MCRNSEPALAPLQIQFFSILRICSKNFLGTVGLRCWGSLNLMLPEILLSWRRLAISGRFECFSPLASWQSLNEAFYIVLPWNRRRQGSPGFSLSLSEPWLATVSDKLALRVQLFATRFLVLRHLSRIIELVKSLEHLQLSAHTITWISTDRFGWFGLIRRVLYCQVSPKSQYGTRKLKGHLENWMNIHNWTARHT